MGTRALLALFALASFLLLAQLSSTGYSHGPPRVGAAYSPQRPPCPAPPPDELPLEHPNITADVRRLAYLNYTLLIIEDNVTVRATGDAELSSFFYGFPIEWVERNMLLILHKEAENASGAPLSFSEEMRLGDMGFFGFLLSFPSPLELEENETASLFIRFVVNGSLSSTGFSEEIERFTYRLEVPLYPTTSLELHNFTFRVGLPARAILSDIRPEELRSEKVKGIWYVCYNATDVPRLKTDVSVIEFSESDPLPLFYCRELTRELSIGSFGGLKVSDEYALRSKTNHEVEYFDVILPGEATSISVSDLMGPLKVRVTDLWGVKRVRITLRTPVKFFDPLTITVSYSLPWEKLMLKNGTTSFSLRFEADECLLWPVERLFVKVVLPEGASVSWVSPEPDYVARWALSEEVGFLLGLTTPFDGEAITVAFSFSVFWPSFWPMCWAGLGAILACALIKLLTVAPVPAPVLLVPAEKIMEFVEAYERKNSLEEELSSLREALNRRRISRKKYKARERAIRHELERLNRRIASLTPELREAGGIVAEAIGALEAAESELRSVERDMQELEARYLRKEIGSKAYRRLLRDYRRREDRARTSIREALLRLRELVM